VVNPSAKIAAAGVTAVAAAFSSARATVGRLRRRDNGSQVVREALAEIATAPELDAVEAAIRRAVGRLTPPGSQHQIRMAAVAPNGTSTASGAPADAGSGLVPIGAVRSPDQDLATALLVDERTAALPRLRPALEMISLPAALAVQRLRLAEEVGRQRSGEYGLAALFEKSGDVVLIVDPHLLIRYASPSARALFGPSASGRRPFLDLVEPSERRAAGSLLRHALTGETDTLDGVSHADWTIRASQGTRLHAEVTCRQLPAGDSVGGLVVALRDVTAQRRIEQELTRRTLHDLLTGLPNRQLFSELVTSDLTTGTGHTGIIVVDLDNFKAINDTLGHDAGDAVLAEVGRRLSEAVGHEGVAARMGDDEFAALLRNVSVQAAGEAAARIASVLAAPVSLDAGGVSCTASVGVTTSHSAETAQDLFKHADLALGWAKAAGHGQWRQYDPLMADAPGDRAALLTALSFATHNDSLTVEYQPITDLEAGRIVGFEALLRWVHPTRGPLRPDTFIHLAEESGLIVPIGEWVLATAMTAAERWPSSQGDPPPFISVNVSPQQFRSAGFLQSIHRLLATTRLPADRLVLEVTETLLVHDDEEAWKDLRRLRRLGIRIAIDDFGTGYSALGYLRHAPLDLVKLDRLFISPLTSSARQRQLVKGMVDLARSLHLDVVAEGIETKQQRDISTAIGCGYGQGYFFARPTPDPETYLSTS
jgi:diguanylate cyclase (GGDEF)-like protein/PAS domain S-box-containing protein